MTVKIDKYRLHHDTNSSAIYDLSTGYKIITLGLMKKEVREKLAEKILNELNTGKYEMGE
ncbi:hypothetical protein [Methanobrevibacter sp.]|uniref:hypothetical protein n=1 Tax=Methanobrevibacter sp. TaxID=66852 RepID=UPI00388D3CAA